MAVDIEQGWQFKHAGSRELAAMQRNRESM